MAAKTDIETWKFLKKDVEFFLLEEGTKEILLQGRFTVNGREFGHGGAFLRLELRDARPSEPVILYLDGNCDYVQCSDTRRFARAYPNQKVKELQWDQFRKLSRIFTFYILEQDCIPNSTPQERLNTVKEILSIPDEQPFIVSESIQGNVDLEMSASFSAWGKKGKEASQASRKKNKRDLFTGKKRMHTNIVEEEEEEE
jgi:hypothetical protein